jgi:mannitol 2-dehydrogenase
MCEPRREGVVQFAYRRGLHTEVELAATFRSEQPARGECFECMALAYKVRRVRRSTQNHAGSQYLNKADSLDAFVIAPLVRVRNETLTAIAARGIPVPNYDRSRLLPCILHLGVGGFHRAHFALYAHELAEAGSDWGIRGLGLLPADLRMRDALAQQDYLYTLVERGSAEPRPRVVGSIVDFVAAVDDPGAFAGQVADPGIEILSLTITESGYSLETRNATIEAIVDGLDARRAGGGAPLTIVSCDNLPGNGTVARNAVTAVCEERDRGLARWVDSACTFPNSMVDRITPQTAESDRAWLRETWGIDDAWPVVTEPFRQWVIEDRFAAGRPRLEEVGVLFTDDVRSWELYKLRMLNAAHSCMAYLAALAGIVYVDEAIGLPPMRRFLERLLREEAIPTLAEIPGHPREDYAETVLRRFENTGVRDQIARLCIDGTAKFPTFLIPTIERQLELAGPVDRAALALAGWARYLATTPTEERAMDAGADRAVPYAVRSLDDPVAFLDFTEVFPCSLRGSERFREAFTSEMRTLARLGPIGAVEKLS